MKPSAELRPQIQTFFSAIRQNDLDTLNSMADKDFPLDWAQTFSETSLPEYAMKHGSVEAAWWLMSKDIMPESWAAFSGEAWKSFLKRGWNLVMSNDGPTIPMEAYKSIIKSGMKKTGEVFPGWLEQTLSSSAKNITTAAGSFFARARLAASDYLENLEKTAQERPSQEKPEPKAQAEQASKKSPKREPSKAEPAKKAVKKKAPAKPAKTIKEKLQDRAASQPAKVVVKKATKKPRP